MLTKRLKKAIPKIINLKQNAFAQDKLITENVLLMHDIVIGYHRKGRNSKVVLKINIMNAYALFKLGILIQCNEHVGISKEVYRMDVQWCN